MTIKRPSIEVNIFFGRLFQARTEIHQYHLKTHVFAEHLATDELYKGLLKIADKIMESTQGAREQIFDFVVPECKAPDNIISYLKELVSYTESCKYLFPADIVNMIDELNGEIHQAMYKLTFLK